MRSMVEGWRERLRAHRAGHRDRARGAGLMGRRPGDPLLQFGRQPSQFSRPTRCFSTVSFRRQRHGRAAGSRAPTMKSLDREDPMTDLTETDDADDAEQPPRAGLRIHPPETWDLARRDYLAGHSGPDVCARYGLGLATFRGRAASGGWRRIDQPAPIPAAPSRWTATSMRPAISIWPRRRPSICARPSSTAPRPRPPPGCASTSTSMRRRPPPRTAPCARTAGTTTWTGWTGWRCFFRCGVCRQPRNLSSSRNACSSGVVARPRARLRCGKRPKRAMTA